MSIRKEIICRYNATYQDGVFVKGDYTGGETLTYNQKSELLESVDRPSDSSIGGEREVYIYTPLDNGGMACEHQIYSLPFEMDREEHLYKKMIHVKDASGRVTEYSEYDIDELIYLEKFIYDENGNNIENLCEYYEDGSLNSARIIQSAFDSYGREITRTVKQPSLFRYNQYKNNGGEVRGDEVESYHFEYDEDGYIAKEIYESPIREKTVLFYRYDKKHRLIEECFESSDGFKNKQVYDYGTDDNLVSESTFNDDILTNRVFYLVKGTSDSPKQVIYTRTEDGKECSIEEIERFFY